MRKNISGQIVAFQAISSTDGSDVTTGSPVVYYTIDGGTQAQTTASAVHEGNGQWTVALTQAETNGDHIAFSFVLTGAISQTLNVYTINADITNLDAAISSRSTFNSASDQVTVSTNNDKTGYSISGTKTTLDALNDIAASAIVSGGAITTSGGAVSNVTLVATTTTNTDMRGTDGANTVAPDNASIAAILVDTGTDIPASIAALNNFDPATDQVIVGTNNDKTGYALSSAANDAIGAAFLSYTLTKGTAGTIERAFWQSLKATQLTDGEVSGTPTSSAFDTNLTAVTGAFDHLLLVFTSGSLAGEARPIDSYSSTNGRITLLEPLTSAPASADEFIVVPDHTEPTADIVSAIFNEPQSGYTTTGTFGYYLDSQISAISSGGGDATAANQTTIIGHLTDIKGGTFDDATDSLEAIRDRGDAAWTGSADEAAIISGVVAGLSESITVSAPVTTTGQLVSPIVIGDDYLAANSRAFQWTVTEIANVDYSTATCHFGLANPRKGSTTVAGTITDNGDGTWNLSFDVARSDTEELEEGDYEWSVAVHDAAGNEITRVRNDGDSYKAVLVDKQT